MRAIPELIGFSSWAISSNVTCVRLRNFMFRIVDRIAFSASLLTAGVYPQNILCETGPLTERGLKQYPRKSKATFS